MKPQAATALAGGSTALVVNTAKVGKQPQRESRMIKMNEVLNQWLRDAHAMEQQAVLMLSRHVDRLEHYPELRSRMEQHIGETKSQRARLEECLEARGTSPSAVKDVAGQTVALLQSLSGVVAGDEVVKGLLASYVFEHMEISSYRILKSAAEMAGDPTTALMCEEICREEEAMANWLADHEPTLVQAYLTRAAAALDEAKR